jgi:peptide/nickel transport system substrate-binding protein
MKKFTAVGAVLTLAFVLAACGGGSSGSSGATSSATGSSEPFPVLHWTSTPIQRADVVTGFSFGTFSLVAPVTQGLMSYDKEGKVIPGLASSVDNPDPTTYIYHLKQGIKFSDGKPLTVEDVVFSLMRNLGKESQSASNFEDVASIKAQGSDAVVIKLKEADVTWPNVPAFCGQILEKAAALKGGIEKLGTPANLPIGTGPYKFTDFNPQTGATLDLNPYWKGQKQTAQEVQVKILKEDSQIALAMRSGEADGSSWPVSERAYASSGAQIVTTPGVNQMALSMNTLVAPFNDIHVRKAIAYATDRKGMIEAIFEGKAELSQTLTPISLYGSIAPAAEVEKTFGSLPNYEFDLAAAKAEMAKSKYPEGFSTTFVAEPTAVKVAQALAPDLAKIGIKMKVEQVTEAAYIEYLFGPRDKLGLTMGYYGAVYPDPSSLMNFWLSPSQAKLNGLNSANYKSAEMAKLLSEQSKATNGDERLQLINSAFQLMKEEVPYVPLFAPQQFIVVSPKFVFEDYSPWTLSFTPWPLLVKKAS